MRYAALEDITRELWDLHISGADCTHSCYAPAFVEALAHLLASTIEADDAAAPYECVLATDLNATHRESAREETRNISKVPKRRRRKRR